MRLSHNHAHLVHGTFKVAYASNQAYSQLRLHTSLEICMHLSWLPFHTDLLPTINAPMGKLRGNA